eukprot:gene4725-biopygen7868
MGATPTDGCVSLQTEAAAQSLHTHFDPTTPEAPLPGSDIPLLAIPVRNFDALTGADGKAQPRPPGERLPRHPFVRREDRHLLVVQALDRVVFDQRLAVRSRDGGWGGRRDVPRPSNCAHGQGRLEDVACRAPTELVSVWIRHAETQLQRSCIILRRRRPAPRSASHRPISVHMVQAGANGTPEESESDIV